MSTLTSLLGRLTRPALAAISRQRLPQVDGRLYLPGLRGQVTIRRDEWGIPHVTASQRQDLFFAQGIVHAQDRLWQMELNRRAATGRLSELLGEATLETDRLTRTLGFNRLAHTSWEKMEGQVAADLEAYVAGVNAYLAGNPPLPVELMLLNHRPEPWRVKDSIAFGRLQGWALSHGWAGELVRAQLVEAVGATLAAELEPQYAGRNPVTLPAGIQFNELALDPMTQAAAGPFLGKGSLDGGGRGSNGWVIAGRHSATGHAILCNDMHLPLTSPSLWYYLHLRLEGEGGYHVAGVSQPGIPYILVGHNDHIAWGATLTFNDVEDLFIEKLHPEDPTRYQFRGEWQPAEIYDERIKVKGKPDHVERVIVTHHGPIISNVLPGTGEALAMASMALRPYETFDGFAMLNEARNWQEFTAAVQRIETPSLNLVYADTQDNIGYYVSGKVPVRAAGQGLTPAPGWTGDHEWVGEIPFGEMPHCLNPAEGYLITSNNRIVNDDYPHFLGYTWMNGYRAKRLDDLIQERLAGTGTQGNLPSQGQGALAWRGEELGGTQEAKTREHEVWAKRRVSLEDCQGFQMDVYSLPGRELVERLAGLETADGDANLCLRLLREWDGWLTTESVGGTIYQVLLARLAQRILGKRLTAEQQMNFLGQGPHYLLYPAHEFYGHWSVTLMRMLDDGKSGWIADENERASILIQCLAETAAELRGLLGDDPAGWQWGKLHQIRFAHAMSVQSPLDLIFNQGPYPIGGDTDTVNQTATLPQRPYECNAFSVSYRQVVDMGNLGNSRAMYAPGQSGHLGSKQYGNLIQPWLNGGYFPMTWEAEKVEKAAAQTLTLMPALR
jgi:penicillin amidase